MCNITTMVKQCFIVDIDEKLKYGYKQYPCLESFESKRGYETQIFNLEDIDKYGIGFFYALAEGHPHIRRVGYHLFSRTLYIISLKQVQVHASIIELNYWIANLS